ncbi:hypothetical protein L202_05618 [Cryptococcus amylolentus CBS 6039]|uniref:Uncharacterized protein n=2 Tax=Cryptococcus amylolentus TaxID=104669 RepID=A0A1E3HNQ6_9TREE|nr:hypothetical protein L202_05618 [Cryptococcus amylolentus CBS 6039]ODN77081.1 hypothetical protein L202_05618 [Cryptococcus amylolentus CBS 6039]ODO04935.1 hypothetical protein I350_05546 [Cryptococcus amylolentus CBS 6273]
MSVREGVDYVLDSLNPTYTVPNETGMSWIHDPTRSTMWNDYTLHRLVDMSEFEQSLKEWGNYTIGDDEESISHLYHVIEHARQKMIEGGIFTSVVDESEGYSAVPTQAAETSGARAISDITLSVQSQDLISGGVEPPKKKERVRLAVAKLRQDKKYCEAAAAKESKDGMSTAQSQSTEEHDDTANDEDDTKGISQA